MSIVGIYTEKKILPSHLLRISQLSFCLGFSNQSSVVLRPKRLYLSCSSYPYLTRLQTVHPVTQYTAITNVLFSFQIPYGVSAQGKISFGVSEKYGNPCAYFHENHSSPHYVKFACTECIKYRKQLWKIRIEIHLGRN
jgi:hypothetical protein